MHAFHLKGRADSLHVAWIAPMAGLVILAVLFSLRLLSDPDLGFHLNAGRWIMQHLAIPQTDIATYTVPDHPYIDLHWLFQVFVYSTWLITGYQGLSILVCILILWLFVLIGRHMRSQKVPYSTIIPLFLLALLIMEPRFFLRPELFTYIFITLFIIILDRHVQRASLPLFWLPLIMVIWCNMEGLFMIGFGLIGAYIVSTWVHDRKPDIKLLAWGALTILVCFINPYGVRGFIFPFELLTRFQHGNVFHEHIKEFQTLFQLENWTVKEYAAVFYCMFSGTSILLTLRSRRVHELILWITFLILALMAIRNIPLFLIVTLPSTGRSVSEILRKTKSRLTESQGRRSELIVAGSLVVIILVLIPRIITNAYYGENLSYNKTGIGLDRRQLPDKVSDFLISNGLSGRMINSLSYGGWLSWRLEEPVFIDARLEVIGEKLYAEVESSWSNGLARLISSYNADLVVYDYNRYFSWTPQLLELPGWRPVYVDGQSAVFARDGFAAKILFPDTVSLQRMASSVRDMSQEEKLALLQKRSPSPLSRWLNGFYKKQECNPPQSQNLASFFLQMKRYRLAELFFLQTLNQTCGAATSCYYALAAIYSESGEHLLASACYRRILEFDPANPMAAKALAVSAQKPVKNLKGLADCLADAEATGHFNKGNHKYREGDVDGALNEFTIAIRLNPRHSKAFLNRAYIQAVEKMDYQSAIRDFSNAIELDPGYSEAYLGRGSSRYSLHDRDGALEDWRRAASLGNRQAHELLAKHQR